MKINFQPKYILIFFALFLACVFGAGGAQAATTTGTFESSVINLGNKVNFTTLSWTASIPAGCPTCGVKFELAVSNDNFTSGTYYTGLSGPGTFYTTSGSTIHTNLNGNQYIKYRATLYTDDTNYSASLSDVSIGYTQYPVLASLESSPFDTKRTYRALQKISWSESG
ncbi:hypothetical protein HY249_00170, partial [Candidatus Azambacteria bacterium]|nr:hypothetical protein [Candidatus Azambacteria bacterium]